MSSGQFDNSRTPEGNFISQTKTQTDFPNNGFVYLFIYMFTLLGSAEITQVCVFVCFKAIN